MCIIQLTVLLLIWLAVLIWKVLKSLVTVRSKNARQDMEEGGRWEGKRSAGREKEKKKKEAKQGKYGQHVTEFLTMFAYEWYCMTMCTCIILIVNLPAV